jgi:hypothetical protein
MGVLFRPLIYASSGLQDACSTPYQWLTMFHDTHLKTSVHSPALFPQLSPSRANFKKQVAHTYNPTYSRGKDKVYRAQKKGW